MVLSFTTLNLSIVIKNKIVRSVFAVLAFCCGACTMGIKSSETDKDDLDEYTFWFGWIGVVFQMVSGIVSFMFDSDPNYDFRL